MTGPNNSPGSQEFQNTTWTRPALDSGETTHVPQVTAVEVVRQLDPEDSERPATPPMHLDPIDVARRRAALRHLPLSEQMHLLDLEMWGESE